MPVNHPLEWRREQEGRNSAVSVYSVVFTSEEGRTEFEVFQIRGEPKSDAERAEDMLKALAQMQLRLNR